MAPSLLTMLRFELGTALPLSLAVLRRRLSGAELASALFGYTRRSLSDPFAALGPAADPAETFTRRQLRPVLALSDALRLDAGLDPERCQALLLEIVAQSGAEFLRSTLELPSLAHWISLGDPARRALVEGLLARFPNAESVLGQVGDGGLDFEVRSCWFAALAQRLERPEVAALFCEADQRFFGDPAVGIELTRPQTLARGGHSCAFYLRYVGAEPQKLDIT